MRITQTDSLPRSRLCPVPCRCCFKNLSSWRWRFCRQPGGRWFWLSSRSPRLFFCPLRFFLAPRLFCFSIVPPELRRILAIGDAFQFDLDKPTEGFASIPKAIEDIRQRKIVIVVDDEDKENEGDMVMATELATPEAMAFFVKHGTSIVDEQNIRVGKKIDVTSSPNSREQLNCIQGITKDPNFTYVRSPLANRPNCSIGFKSSGING
ncbi:hypothetical protein Cgig2_006274 [Carnegiea gigantea]|uniref:3,4-dihydroxy-2-butanone-4-phosphate synthase n=1 Tax=Carnegiea gigantea TaxID=171969 RepID=A0A9Q1K0F4_9CARY|nr:hypothetical protein Cgig2_006274 [Carnegiea gigantea]